MVERLADTAVLWMLTYGLHGTALLLVAFAVSKWMKRRRLAIQELLWKVALAGSLITATLQVGFGLKPLTTSWELSEAHHEIITPVPLVDEENAMIGFKPEAKALVLPESHSVAFPAGSSISSGPADAPFSLPNWKILVAGAWLSVGLALAMGLFLSYRRLNRKLHAGTEIERGPLPLALARLLGGTSLHGKIKLTRVRGIRVPLARIIPRPEICLPQRIFTGLTAEQQETLLAHEIAHILHRDPLWLLFSHAMERFFFFQPLNRVARIQLQRLSEFRCDDWAAERTGRPLVLARCLAEVAGWQLGRTAALLPGIAPRRRSDLGHRVHLLLDGNKTFRSLSPRWAGLLALVGLALVIPVVPGFTRATASSKTEPPAPLPVSAKKEPVKSIAPPVTPAEKTEKSAPRPSIKVTRITEPTDSPEPSPEPFTVALEAPAVTEPTLADTPHLVNLEAVPAAVPAAPEAPSEAMEETASTREDEEDEGGEVEDILDELEEELDAVTEIYEEEFEAEVEEFEETFERMEDKVENRSDRRLLEWRAERIEKKIEQFEEEAEDRLEVFEEAFEHFESRYERRIESFEDHPSDLTSEVVDELLRSLRRDLNTWRTNYRTEIRELTAKVKKLERKYG